MDNTTQEEANQVSLVFICVSAGFLICYIFIIIPLRLHNYKKKMESQKSFPDLTLKSILTNAASETIFEYLDLLTTENTAFSPTQNRDSTYSQPNKFRVDMQQTPQVIQKQLNKRAKKQNFMQYHQMQNVRLDKEFTGAVICDCYECCCQGCPWQVSKENVVFLTFSQYNNQCSNWFFRHQKFFAFFMIKLGSFAFIPFNNLFYFVKSNTVIFLGGLIFTSSQFFIETFTLSFLSTRREIVRLEKHNQIQRALLIYYHFRKALVFTSIYIILIVAITYLIFNFFGETDGFIWNTFEYLNYYFNIAMNINLLVLLKYTNCLTNNLISDDDRILKAQQRLWALQNNLIKYVPSDEVWLENLVQQLDHMNKNKLQQEDDDFLKFQYDENEHKNLIKQQNQIQGELKQILDMKCQKASEKLIMHINSIEVQKFKKIKKNLGTKRYQISVLIIYMYLQCIALLILSILLSLVFVGGVSQNPFFCNNSPLIIINLEFFNTFSKANIHALTIGYYSLITMQYTLMPYLIGVMCYKKSLFGQDYGQRQKQFGMQDSIEINGQHSIRINT